MIVYQDRCDQGTFIEEVQLAGAERYGLRYDVGGINVHLRQFRTDGIADAAIYWTESGNDLLCLDGFTVDNQRLDLATSGGGAHRRWVGIAEQLLFSLRHPERAYRSQHDTRGRPRYVRVQGEPELCRRHRPWRHRIRHRGHRHGHGRGSELQSH